MDLILLAVSAIQKGDEAKVGEVFIEVFRTASRWEQIQHAHDWAALQALLEHNPALRKQVIG